MMNLLRRRALMIAAQQNTVPVWDGVTVTTPALVDGYYEIYDGATLAGFNALAVDNKKGRVTADFALNRNWENYNSWGTTPPSSALPNPSTSLGSEFDGGGHTIYGLYTVYGLLKCTIMHHLKVHGALLKNTMLFNGVSGDTKAYACEFVGNIENTSSCGAYGYRNYTSEFVPHDLSFYGIVKTTTQSGGLYGQNYYPIKNCSAIGSIIVPSGNSAYVGGGWGSDDSTTKSVNNCFESMLFSNPSGTSNAFGLGASVSMSYYDSTKIGAAIPQGIAKTTDEIKSQAFVNLLNANVPAGCLQWKLETKGLLTGWPVLNF